MDEEIVYIVLLVVSLKEFALKVVFQQQLLEREFFRMMQIMVIRVQVSCLLNYFSMLFLAMIACEDKTCLRGFTCKCYWTF